MKLEIITPDATVFDGEASLVQLPGYDGSFEILKNHAPMISVLKKGSIRIKTTTYAYCIGIEDLRGTSFS